MARIIAILHRQGIPKHGKLARDDRCSRAGSRLVVERMLELWYITDITLFLVL